MEQGRIGSMPCESPSGPKAPTTQIERSVRVPEPFISLLDELAAEGAEHDRGADPLSASSQVSWIVR
jgi:hypothetical protein